MRVSVHRRCFELAQPAIHSCRRAEDKEDVEEDAREEDRAELPAGAEQTKQAALHRRKVEERYVYNRKNAL
eukprot:6188677-Pleurochrysis_carterae.AAC.3